jgi:transposase
MEALFRDINRFMDILNFPNWQIIQISEEATHFFIRAKHLDNAPSACPFCSADPILTRNYGIRIRSIKDFPIRRKAVSILLSIQRHKCLVCGKTYLRYPK